MKFDAALNEVASQDYPAYDGWTPLALTVATNNHTFILWRHINGSTSLWQVDQNLIGVAGGGYYSPPDYGWSAQGLSSGPAGQVQIMWRLSDGRVSVYSFQASVIGLKYIGRQFHAPFANP